MSTSTSLIDGTIVVKDVESYIVYSPFDGIITRSVKFPKKGNATYRAIKSKGFFRGKPQSTSHDNVPTWSGFRSLTLFLTRRCNLNCLYCYANAVPNGESMSTDLALHSLQWFNDQLKEKNVRVCFHGGGEPTLEQSLIKTVVDVAKRLEPKRPLRFQIVTNGTASIPFMEWLMQERFGISISADGPPEIQNRNRPLISGGESSNIIENTILHMIKKEYPFTVRLTLSATDDVIRIVNYFGDLGVHSLHLEPLFPYGRKSEKNVIPKAPKGKELITSFLQAMATAKERGIHITNSHLVHFTKGIGYFCGAASGRSMMVTHDGFLSGCLEVTDSFDKDFSHFVLGRYLQDKKQFFVDKGKLAILQSRHADSLSNCKKCYARYTCAGGCAVKAVRASGNFFERDLPYCLFTRALVPILVKRIAAASLKEKGEIG